MAYANGWLRYYDPKQFNDVVALGRIFENMSSIEHIVHEHIQSRVTQVRANLPFNSIRRETREVIHSLDINCLICTHARTHAHTHAHTHSRRRWTCS